MDRSEAIEIVAMLKTLIHHLDIRPIWESSHIEKVKPSSTAFVLSKAINAIEYLDSRLEDYVDERPKLLSQILEFTGKTHEQEEKIKQLENHITELIRDRDDVVEHWTKHCENLFHEHRKCLAAKDREIYYWRDLAKKIADQNGCEINSCYPKTMINNPANFCGNCKHYAQMHKDNDTYEGICVQHYIKRVDPDDASCEHFKPNQVDRVIISKPEFPCCEHCTHEDCDDCTLCPF